MKILCVGGELDGAYLDTGNEKPLPEIRSMCKSKSSQLSGVIIDQSYKLISLADKDNSEVMFYLHGDTGNSPLRTLLSYYEATVRDFRSVIKT